MDTDSGTSAAPEVILALQEIGREGAARKVELIALEADDLVAQTSTASR